MKWREWLEADYVPTDRDQCAGCRSGEHATPVEHAIAAIDYLNGWLDWATLGSQSYLPRSTSDKS